MKDNKSTNWSYLLLTVALLVAPFAAQVLMAQPPPPPPPPPPPVVVPLGGLGLLIAGLAAFGAKKYFNKEK